MGSENQLGGFNPRTRRQFKHWSLLN